MAKSKFRSRFHTFKINLKFRRNFVLSANEIAIIKSMRDLKIKFELMKFNHLKNEPEISLWCEFVDEN